MKINHLIYHPEDMNKETLYDLRSLLALYPYYQTARLLMLQNLYILHDPDFDKELRQAAIYITDRKVIFKMIEAAHYKLHQETEAQTRSIVPEEKESRTAALIDNFLDTMPKEDGDKKNSKRQPTPADAAIDYVSYLLEAQEEEKSSQEMPVEETSDRTTSLIDNFLEVGGFNLELQDEETEKEEPESQKSSLQEENNEEETENNESYFTETLARIYIKQGRYEKALEIIKRLYLNYPKKNAYFADQMRFLEKLIINNKNKK
ncbi:MAG TPA: hypothetical protein DCS83_01820 [Prevotella sp.]|nr:hypothetical protein [Prevotella sp.]